MEHKYRFHLEMQILIIKIIYQLRMLKVNLQFICEKMELIMVLFFIIIQMEHVHIVIRCYQHYLRKAQH